MTDEIQHDRLTELESAVRDISYKTGSIEAGQAHLTALVKDGFEGVQSGLQGVKDEQKGLDTRLKPFEEAKARSTRRWDIAKKGIIPGIAAMAGLFGAKFGGVIWDALSKLF
jgi:hypothetical protein